MYVAKAKGLFMLDGCTPEKKGLPPEKAKEILDKMAVVEDIVPGFQVWMMYDETSNVFGSFVTQGAASQTVNWNCAGCWKRTPRADAGF